MDNQFVYTKTGKGMRTLQHCESLLSHNECQVLSQVNGKFTLEEIGMRLAAMPNKAFLLSIGSLEKKGYIRQLLSDADLLDGPPSVLGVDELDTERGVREWAEANRAAEALTKAGYYLPQGDTPQCNGPQQILIVDDDPIIGEAASAVLRGEGYKVEWIVDPTEALSKIVSMPCLTLVLLDVVMPQANGFDVLRQIRAQPQLHQLPVVMLTAHATPEYVSEGLREGADGYILKPFRPEKMVRYLQETLKIRVEKGITA